MLSGPLEPDEGEALGPAELVLPVLPPFAYSLTVG